MFRRTAQWIAYFIIVIALVCGLEVIGIFLFSRNHPCLWARTFGLCYGVRSV